jgi:hypothetical protein
MFQSLILDWKRILIENILIEHKYLIKIENNFCLLLSSFYFLIKDKQQS